MKIVDNRKTVDRPTVDQIPPGGIFSLDGKLYLKLKSANDKPEGVVSQVVRLSTFTQTTLGKSVEVVFHESTLSLEGVK